LAYQIAEHSGRTGERYIAGSSKELRMMFRSAMGGGLIISFIAMIKTLLGKWTLAPFWQGFLYSVNYSLGFVLIQDTGSTLATKQPAYTANNVASSLDARKVGDRPDLRNLAITLAKVSRTQLASFVGNLIVVFPGAFVLAWAYAYFFGSPIVDEATAQTMLRSQQPLHSLALLYACFTGFFLFLSGLIAGYVENHVVYGRIGERFNQARFIKHNFSEARRYRMVQYINSKLGALVGNLALGFFLGMAGFIGYTFGLPFDIRHITISAANVSISAVTLGNSVAWTVWAYTLVGVALIGFLNFAVSFGLAFLVAVKSRGIHLRDYPQLVGIVWRYFLRYPRDFFRAPVQREAHQLSE
jgi:site-specific recombinase